MKRVVLFLNGTDVNGKVFMVTHSVEELLAAASVKFEIVAKRIFTPQGGEIEDIKLVRDDDVLYVSNGEDFILREQNKIARCSDWVTLNVGGKYFSTTRSTLINKEPMRVLEEARFYGIEGAVSILEEMAIDEEKREKGTASLTRHDVLKAIMCTPISSELRFQGVNLVGADLSRLDLRNINFKYANLHGCSLEGANLSGCCLERADLSSANLEGAHLVCVKMLCANLEAANLHSCNFEDPGGLSAIMEGVNLKGANLEGSNMAAVNLRVATLKNAILKNCDLRSACLAGADLQSCDLSGSDLHEANLRGANLKDAVFDLMLTPLHMSQTIR
ncbi:BTB/POZ domain-containing protein KCTD9 isoform X4 [Belonocnema kinseyi]|uniref:BTB/POZ domain-containing protein KCTD9 isoform X4 n=1 Tax=Belonocnema kinseyi TaxID=2817044 RepID=UPI00143DD408|nr:BTB/POZ domain-containing protein KCTD9 isoform X4 [Belonocnema kinseyi]